MRKKNPGISSQYPKQEVHPLFGIVSAMDLEAEAHWAFQSAQFYLEQTKRALQLPMPPKTEDSKAFLRHVRGFFWELVATFDTVLCWCNQRFELQIKDERNLTWSGIEENKDRAKRHKLEWQSTFKLLANTKYSPWYFEVQQYRNFAHRAHLFSTTWYEENRTGDQNQRKVTLLRPARKDQPPYQDIVDQLSNYLEQMGQVGKILFEKSSSEQGINKK